VTAALVWPHIPVVPVIDILLVAFLIYQFLALVRGTRAAPMLVGVATLALAFYFARLGELRTLNWLLSTLLPYVVFALIVVFQSEIRHALANLGSRVSLMRSSSSVADVYDDVVLAANLFSQNQTLAFLPEFDRIAAATRIVSNAPVIFIMKISAPDANYDADRITRYRAGDQKAFAELVNAHLPAVYSFVARYVGNTGEADDVVQDVVIRDRRHLSEDGIVLPIIAINRQTGRVESPPEIVSRGFALAGDGSAFMENARLIVTKTLESSNREEKTDWGVMKEKVRADLKRYIVKETSRRPLIMPVILEV